MMFFLFIWNKQYVDIIMIMLMMFLFFLNKHLITTVMIMIMSFCWIKLNLKLPILLAISNWSSCNRSPVPPLRRWLHNMPTASFDGLSPTSLPLDGKSSILPSRGRPWSVERATHLPRRARPLRLGYAGVQLQGQQLSIQMGRRPRHRRCQGLRALPGAKRTAAAARRTGRCCGLTTSLFELEDGGGGTTRAAATRPWRRAPVGTLSCVLSASWAPARGQAWAVEQADDDEATRHGFE
jgi:hypothetical protein